MTKQEKIAHAKQQVAIIKAEAERATGSHAIRLNVLAKAFEKAIITMEAE